MLDLLNTLNYGGQTAFNTAIIQRIISLEEELATLRGIVIPPPTPIQVVPEVVDKPKRNKPNAPSITTVETE